MKKMERQMDQEQVRSVREHFLKENPENWEHVAGLSDAAIECLFRISMHRSDPEHFSHPGYPDGSS